MIRWGPLPSDLVVRTFCNMRTDAQNRVGRRLMMVVIVAVVAPLVGLRSWAADAGGASGDTGAGGGSAIPGPSLSETGKVGASKLEGKPPPASIRPAPKLARPEPPVAPSHGGAGAAPAASAEPSKIPVPRAVQEAVKVRLRELNACRVDVARDKHRSPKDVRAGTLLLRFTIGLDGSVSGTEVVAVTPVDPAIMECAQQTITKWKFAPPDQGPLAIERRHRFPS
ncbi:MAG TPA: hypothetical protein VIU64_21570 [Polyangia bacterium]